jgi:hypothetical protein
MPALNPPAAETATHGQLRRRVWKHPELRSHSLLVLTIDQLRLTPLAGDPKPETLAAVEQGADLDEVLDPLTTVIALSAVRRAKLDLLSNSLVLEYPAGIRPGRLVVTFATPEAADVCFTKVWRRLGDSCRLARPDRDWSAMARTPLAVLVAVLLLTAALAVGLHLTEDSASRGSVSVVGAAGPGTHAPLPRSPLDTLAGWLNWKVVCGIGGVVAAVVQVWLYRRLTQPPAALELVRAETADPAAYGTGLY